MKRSERDNNNNIMEQYIYMKKESSFEQVNTLTLVTKNSHIHTQRERTRTRIYRPTNTNVTKEVSKRAQAFTNSHTQPACYGAGTLNTAPKCL